MELKSDIELANTRVKLRELQARYDAHRDNSTEDARVRRLSMMSLKRLINQLTEEIARAEARLHTVGAGRAVRSSTSRPYEAL